MEAILDRFGRIVIPKKIREEFNLGPGSPVSIEAGKEGILLRPVEGGPNLIEKKRVLVYSGKPVGDLEKTLHELRQGRNQLLGGWIENFI